MDKQTERKLEIGTKVFLQNTEGKFLMLKRTKPYLGEDFCRWDIPGGRIIPGETQLEALQREVREETGLELDKTEEILGVQDILRVPNKHTVRITYLARISDSSIIKLDPEEHTEYQWLRLEELSKITYDIFLEPIIQKLT